MRRVSSIKQLVGQTALYGLPSIVGRLLNFLLVPIHTAAMGRGEFGVVTDLYVWVAVLIVLLTYGMETSFFYFASKTDDSKRVFLTGMLSIVLTTLLFYGLFEFYSEDITAVLRYENHPHYLKVMVWILCIDVFAALPFARLRHQGKAVRFVVVKMSLFVVNIGLNLFLFLVLPHFPEWQFDFLGFTRGDFVGYVLIANLLASSTMILLLLPQLKPLLQWQLFDADLLRKMFIYGLPLMLAGLAGIANELADRQFLKYLLPRDRSMEELGIYGAVYKLSIFLVLFVQAYRYAAEPFFFKLKRTTDSAALNARILQYFTLVLGLVVIGLNATLPILKTYIDEKFWVGLDAAPVLFAANFILGMNTHLSIWYKLSNKTWYAGVITGVGLIFTVALNILWIPSMGWMGAAWATLCSYFVMASLNAILGQRFAPMPYNWKVLMSYFISSLLLGFFAWKWQSEWGLWSLIFTLPYIALVAVLERTTWQRMLIRRK